MGLVKLDLTKLKKASVIHNEKLEALATQVRGERDKRIAVTDFYLLPDATQQPEGLLAYRQALRDITIQEGFPENVVWPVMGE